LHVLNGKDLQQSAESIIGEFFSILWQGARNCSTFCSCSFFFSGSLFWI